MAAIALIVALARTAMAAPIAIKSILNKKEKKQVKNISKNQVNGLAPGLSVKHADSAGSADTAKDANALSGNTIVAEGDLDGPGFVRPTAAPRSPRRLPECYLGTTSS